MRDLMSDRTQDLERTSTERDELRAKVDALRLAETESNAAHQKVHPFSYVLLSIYLSLFLP